MNAPAIVRSVRSFLLILPLLSLFFCTGCEAIEFHHFPTHYYRVHVTNVRGELVADWIAEGKVWRTFENTYRFRAVERITAPPYSQYIRYPEGRHMEISGSNIIVTPCGTPLWRYEGEHD